MTATSPCLFKIHIFVTKLEYFCFNFFFFFIFWLCFIAYGILVPPPGIGVPQKVPDIFYGTPFHPLQRLTCLIWLMGVAFWTGLCYLMWKVTGSLPQRMCAPVEKGRIPSVDSSVGPSRGETERGQEYARGSHCIKCNLRPEAKSLQEAVRLQRREGGLRLDGFINTS